MTEINPFPEFLRDESSGQLFQNPDWLKWHTAWTLQGIDSLLMGVEGLLNGMGYTLTIKHLGFPPQVFLDLQQARDMIAALTRYFEPPLRSEASMKAEEIMDKGKEGHV